MIQTPAHTVRSMSPSSRPAPLGDDAGAFVFHDSSLWRYKCWTHDKEAEKVSVLDALRADLARKRLPEGGDRAGGYNAGISDAVAAVDRFEKEFPGIVDMGTRCERCGGQIAPSDVGVLCECGVFEECLDAQT